MIKSKSKFIVIMVMIFTLLSVTLLSTSAKVVTSRLVLKYWARLESSTPYPNTYPKPAPADAPLFRNYGGGTKLKPTTMFKDKRTGITGYCIEYGVPATGRVDMTVHDWKQSPYWKSFNNKKQEEFKKALLYGYPKYNDPSLPDCDEYVATQCVIWEIQTGKDIISEVLNSNSSKKAYTRLKEGMAEHSRTPSFNNNTITLKWDENSKKFKASVTDTNNELAKFSYQNVHGIKMTKSGNTLNIEADNPIPTAKTIRANKTTVPKADNTGMFVLEHKEKQNCIFGNTYDPVYSSLKVQTEPVNLVRKVSVNTGKFLSGATLELIRVSTGEVVEEWVSNSQFKVFPRLNVGERYVINERITPNGYMKEEPIVFVVNGKPVVVESKFVAEKMQGTVDVEIEVDVTKLAGEKVVVFEEVYYDEHGINNTVFWSRYIS